MSRYQTPTPDEHHRFLASFLFGGTATPTAREAVWRAYLDLSRTVHRINLPDPSGELRRNAHRHVQHKLEALLSSGPRDQPGYDTWHRTSCVELVEQFRRGGYAAFSIGQSQKWYNMAVKYSLTLAAVGWLEVMDASALRSVGHAPIDTFFLNGLTRLINSIPMPGLRTRWSRLADYDEYFAFQTWLRNEFDASPLDVEFHVWQQISAERRQSSAIGLTLS